MTAHPAPHGVTLLASASAESRLKVWGSVEFPVGGPDRSDDWEPSGPPPAQSAPVPEQAVPGETIQASAAGGSRRRSRSRSGSQIPGRIWEPLLGKFGLSPEYLAPKMRESGVAWASRPWLDHQTTKWAGICNGPTPVGTSAQPTMRPNTRCENFSTSSGDRVSSTSSPPRLLSLAAGSPACPCSA